MAFLHELTRRSKVFLDSRQSFEAAMREVRPLLARELFKPFLADYYAVDARAQLHSGDICQFVLLMLRSRFARFRQATGSRVNLL